MKSSHLKECKSLMLVAFVLGPLAVQAQTTPTTYSGLVNLVIGFINILIPTMFAIVFVVLMWRMFDAWVINAGDPAKRAEGKQTAITAVIVLVVAVSVLGIVQIIRTSFLGA